VTLCLWAYFWIFGPVVERPFCRFVQCEVSGSHSGIAGDSSCRGRGLSLQQYRCENVKYRINRFIKTERFLRQKFPPTSHSLSRLTIPRSRTQRITRILWNPFVHYLLQTIFAIEFYRITLCYQTRSFITFFRQYLPLNSVELPVCYQTRSFITFFRQHLPLNSVELLYVIERVPSLPSSDNICHWILYWSAWKQSTSCHLVSSGTVLIRHIKLLYEYILAWIFRFIH
jgi:hypothetical protein